MCPREPEAQTVTETAITPEGGQGSGQIEQFADSIVNLGRDAWDWLGNATGWGMNRLQPAVEGIRGAVDPNTMPTMVPAPTDPAGAGAGAGARVGQVLKRLDDYWASPERLALYGHNIPGPPPTGPGSVPLGPGPVPAAARASIPQPLPATIDPSTLIVGQTYRLRDGRIVVWDGTAFDLAE